MRPRKNPDAVARDIGDAETIVLGSEGRAVVLNAVGGAVWDLVDGQRELRDVAAVIGEHFPNVEPEQLLKDVQALVDQLVAEKLLIA